MSEELIYINGSYQRPNSVKKEVSKAVKELVGLAPEEFDTMQELAEAVQENTKAIQDNAEALQNVKIEAAAPLEFKDGEVKLNYDYDSGLQVIDKRLCLKKASIYHMGGVKIGTGYDDNNGGLEVDKKGRIGLLPPGVGPQGVDYQKSSLGGIKTPKIHDTTPSIATVLAGSYYQIETDVYGNAFVRIPEPPESSDSVDTATIEKAGIVKLGTGTINGETVPVSTDTSGKLALAIGPNLHNDAGVLNIKIADDLTPGVIKLGTGDTIRDTSGTKYGLNYSDSEGAYVTIPNNNSTPVENASVSNFGIVKLGMSSFDTSRKQPVGEGQFSTGTGLGFPIGTGLASTGNTLHVSIGTGLILNNEDLNVGLDENLFEWNPSTKKISIRIDNLKTQLGL